MYIRPLDVLTARAWGLAALVAAAFCAGCQPVDKFAERGVLYNIQAEHVQDQDLLLNIIRASKQRPLQFTGLQSVSGTASLSSTGTLTFPFGPNSAESNSIAVGATASGGPTFNVGVLDTQEFFEGILKPVPLQIFDFYAEEGYSQLLLYDLFIDQIRITQESDGVVKTLVFRNNVDSDDTFDRFQSAAIYLIDLGLRTAPQPDVKPYGPLLTAGEVDRVDSMAKAATAGLDVTAVKVCSLSDGTLRLFGSQRSIPVNDANLAALKKVCADNKGNPTPDQIAQKIPRLPAVLYQAQKTDKGFKFCFDSGRAAIAPPELADAAANLAKDADLACNPPKTAPSVAGPGKASGPTHEAATGQIDAGGTAALSDAVLGPAFERLSPAVGERIDFRKAVTIAFTPRSTDGVLYYVGMIVRRALEPRFRAERRLIEIPWGPASEEIPLGMTCDPNAGTTTPAHHYECEPIFAVNYHREPGAADIVQNREAFTAVEYEGNSYTIAPDGAGRSSQVLDMLTQLIAVNKSAKDLPAASSFTLISP